MEYVHKTVLLNEAVDNLHLKENGIYVDATLGGGGHTKLILSKLKGGKLISFDQDIYAINRAKGINDDRLILVNDNFSNLKENLDKLGIDGIDGIVYDLGVSSFQFDIPERGFSYNYDALLDMRMDQSKDFKAYDIVNKYSYDELVRVFFRYGEESESKRIASNIIKRREENPITTTFELVDVIKEAMTNKRLREKGHPAKKIFQALRIEVNDELKVFEKSLYEAISMLNSGGYVVVITFHSLEDRICKVIFKEKSTIDIPKNVPIISNEKPPLEIITKKPIVPSDEELENNNRAHSAKMRVGRKN